ncbi:MAG: hypothetical protein J6S86_03455 [Alphaproteobacteria bacterium]|nr:hypothetical protein [Alphaproteobacteria bacterium]
MKKSMIALIISSFLIFSYFENVEGNMLGFFGNVNEFPSDIETTPSATSESNFSNTVEFNLIYRNLPETGTTTRNFAFSTANPKFQKVFQPHFKRIKLINCRNLHKNLFSDQQKSAPKLSATELYSGPAALKLAQSGKKVVVLIFADSTNAGGIYLIKRGNPANTQEEQTILMAPEIYGYLKNKFGVNNIGGRGDGIYRAEQKRYCLNKDDYKSPEIINPAYGFILTNLLVTHDVENCSKMIKLPKDKVVEISYAFLSMPSFATDVSKDPTGAMLTNYSEENDGEKIYDRMNRAFSILLKDGNANGRDMLNNKIKRDIGKIAIFCPIEKLLDFSKRHLNKNLDTSEIIAQIIKLKLKKSDKVKNIFDEVQKNYERCVLNKFINLIRGAETAEADTLVLGKIGCGAFLNDENEIAFLLGQALTECKSIKHVYFAGLSKTDPFVEKVRTAMENHINSIRFRKIK